MADSTTEVEALQAADSAMEVEALQGVTEVERRCCWRVRWRRWRMTLLWLWHDQWFRGIGYRLLLPARPTSVPEAVAEPLFGFSVAYTSSSSIAESSKVS